ncbi:MAG: glycosyltransferase family 2 protein [Spartobacteria bacterium]|nr:glycosyltransferase family 2 protein [Spartobacteria bacterium]
MQVGVVLVHWNSGDFTRTCIQSLLDGSLRPWRILVWDNNSEDGAITEIRERYPEVQVVAHPKNVGFAEACNRASALLIQEGADTIWLLNNDTVVDPQCLSELAGHLETHPEVCMTTAKIYFTDHPNRIWYAGGTIRPVSLRLSFQRMYEEDDGRDSLPRYVSFASGCCMLLRADGIKKFGLFVPSFIAYSEDYELCLKLKYAGQKILYIPSSKLWHKVSASCKSSQIGVLAGTVSPLQHYWGTRNSLWALRLNVHNPFLLCVAICLFFADRMYISCGLLLFRRWEKLKMLWRGFAAGLLRLPPSNMDLE